MSIIRGCLKIVLVSILFYACKKSSSPEENSQLLIKIVSKSGDSVLYTSFNYDLENRLVGITDSNINGGLWKTSILYNSQDKPTKYEILDNANGSYSDSLIYNSNNQVSQKLLHSFSIDPYKLMNAYNYDGQGRLIADTMYNYWNSEIYGYTEFTYDNNDNIIQSQHFLNSLGTFVPDGTITTSYNSSITPYNNLGIVLYLIRGEDYLLSKHNRSEVTYYNGTNLNYTYDYNDNGLPHTTVITNNSGGPFSVENIEFFYENP